VKPKDVPRPDTLRRQRRTGRVKSAVRRDRSHAQRPFGAWAWREPTFWRARAPWHPP